MAVTPSPKTSPETVDRELSSADKVGVGVCVSVGVGLDEEVGILVEVGTGVTAGAGVSVGPTRLITGFTS